MEENNPGNYLNWITPQPGDSTYSILKAHLLFEELLNSYLGRQLPHVSALQGARLSFSQSLSMAQASSTHLPPEHWIWSAINSLNKIRNSLSHEVKPRDLPDKIKSYVDFVLANTGRPLPEPACRHYHVDPPLGSKGVGHVYAAIDMVTIDLYYAAVIELGFSLALPSNNSQ